MENSSTLETLEGLTNALANNSTHHVGALEILYGLVKVRECQKLLTVLNKSTFILKRAK